MFEKFIQAVRAGILSVSEDYTNRLKIEGKDVGSIQGQLKVNIVFMISQKGRSSAYNNRRRLQNIKF